MANLRAIAPQSRSTKETAGALAIFPWGSHLDTEIQRNVDHPCGQFRAEWLHIRETSRQIHACRSKRGYRKPRV
jgi:hypothetical protein